MDRVVIAGGKVVDGTGAPAVDADVADRGRPDRRDRAEPAGRSAPRRRRVRGDARLRRHPHPLRRPGVLGPGADAVVLPRRHHGGGRQLRVQHRPDPARRPRTARPHDGEGRGHGSRVPRRRHPVGRVRVVPRVPRRGAPAGHGAQLRRLHRPHAAAALRHGRRGRRPGGDARGDRRHGRRSPRRPWRPAPPGSPPAWPSPTSAPTAGRSRAAWPTGPRSRRSAAPSGRSGRGVVGVNGGEGLGVHRLLRPAAAARRADHVHRGADDPQRRPPARRPRSTARAWRRGADVWPQVSCRPLSFSINLIEPFNLNTNPVFAELMPRLARRAAGRVRRPGVAPAGPRCLGRRARASSRAGTPTRSWSRPPIPSSSASGCRRRRRAGHRSVRHAARPQRRRARPQGAAGQDDPRQRRPRRDRACCSTSPAARSACPTPAPTSASCATPRCRPTCSATGSASARSSRSRRRCTS